MTAPSLHCTLARLLADRLGRRDARAMPELTHTLPARISRAFLGVCGICALSGYLSAGLSADEGPQLIAPFTVPVASPSSVFELDLAPVEATASPRLMIDRAPVDATLEQTDTGWTLSWPTPDTLPLRSRIVLMAVDNADPSLRQRIEVEVVGSAAETASRLPAESVTEVSDTVAYTHPLTLPELPTQTLIAGQRYSLWLRTSGTLGDERTTIEAVNPPDGLSFVSRSNDWFQLDWIPDERDLGEHDIELLATSQQDAMRQVRSRLVLTVVEEGAGEPAGALANPSSNGVTTVARDTPTAEPASPTLQEPEPTSALPAPPAVAPILEHLPNLIVSAGRTIQFKVAASVPAGQDHVIQIDRLPRNASFEENPDGSRTFHWLTGDRDQGEHRFRFTTMNAEDSSLRDTQDITVIVGDPTRSKTGPND